MTDDFETTIQRLLRAHTEDSVYQIATETLPQIISADQTAIVPATECTRETQAWASTESLEISNQRPLLSGIIGRACSTGESCIVDDLLDTRSASTQSTPVDTELYRSLLCVPVDGWGIFVALASDAAAFSADDLESFIRLRTYVSAALTRIEEADGQQQRDEHLQEVANVIGHDIRNLLTVANGQLALAKEDCNSDHLSKIDTTHERIEELVDDVIRLAHSGSRAGTIEATDLQEIAERAWTVLQPGDAELIIDDSLTFLADESLLSQLFENLFRNAISHGGSSITVHVGSLDDLSGFYVADTGSGVPREERKAIFDSGYSTDPEGTGLGLTIVENIADTHGWDITVTDSTQGGARFEITDVEAG